MSTKQYAIASSRLVFSFLSHSSFISSLHFISVFSLHSEPPIIVLSLSFKRHRDSTHLLFVFQRIETSETINTTLFFSIAETTVDLYKASFELENDFHEHCTHDSFTRFLHFTSFSAFNLFAHSFNVCDIDNFYCAEIARAFPDSLAP